MFIFLKWYQWSYQATQWEDPALSLLWISSQPLQSPTSHQSDQSRLEWKSNQLKLNKLNPQPVLRQSGEKSIGSESVMMSFQGWNWTTGLIISRGQYLTEDQPCIGKPRRPQVPGWRWWGRKGGQPWAAAEHSNRKHSPLTSDQWSHQADHVSRISCFLNWDIDIN